MEATLERAPVPAHVDLVYKHENTLKLISMVFSAVLWLVLLFATVGIALLFIPVFLLLYVFAQSAFISRLKGNGIKVTAEQFPDLHARLLHCCRAIGLESVPDCYLLRTDTFNALATRFFGRDFVVLFTNLTDSLRDDPAALNFYIGHELGHVHRKHLKRHAFLLPASILPIIGAAYRRAQEYTCDRYGFASCETAAAAQRGLLAIGAGDSRYRLADPERFAGQNGGRASFWLSFHELLSDYPWLTKRMGQINALASGRPYEAPGRNPFAWLLALFIPRAGVGGSGSVLVIVAIVGILAAIAIPAYQDFVARASVTQALSTAEPFRAAVTEYATQNQAWPASTEDLREWLPADADTSAVELFEGGLITVTLQEGPLSGRTVHFEPQVANNELSWRCYSEDIEAKRLPAACR